jgi:RimJ/RimL family protein N-acetyltransferase
MTSPALRTERLLLEPYTPADEDAFVALFQDERVSRWIGDGPRTEAEDRALFRRIFPVYAEQRFDVWAVRRVGAPGDVIGHAEIKRTDAVAGHEIVYALAPAAWGAGLGTELARTLVAYGFEALGLDAVHATVAAPNEASLKVLKRVGFEHVRDVVEDDGRVTVVLTAARQD